MNVTFDTNIFRQDLGFKSRHLEPLFKYLDRTKSKMIMTQIVWEELGGVYEKELIKLQSDLASIEKRMSKIQLRDHPSLPSIDTGDEVRLYLEDVKKKIGLLDGDVVPYQGHYLPDLVNRAIKRIRPCSDDGEEFRDAILWLTVKDIARQDGNRQVAFISNNTKQFANKEGALHHTLSEEADLEGLNIYYYTSVFSFLASHSPKIGGISKEWIEECQDTSLINDEVKDWVGYGSSRRIIDAAAQAGYHPTGNFEVLGIQTELDEYYIDDRDNENKLVIDAIYRGDIGVAVEVAELESTPLTTTTGFRIKEQSDDGSLNDDPKFSYDTILTTKVLAIPLRATVELVASYSDTTATKDKNEDWSQKLDFADVHLVEVNY